MATIRDVARLAGVSVATVSCHLSGSKPVKTETRIKIDHAIQELKYVPNTAARQLKKATTKTIGVILPDFNEHLYTEVFQGIVKFFQAQGIYVNVAFSQSNPNIEQRAFFNFAHQNVMGLLVISCQPQNREFFQLWQNSYRIPLVFCMHRVEGVHAGFICFDDRGSARHISSALLKAGYRRQFVLSSGERFSSEAAFLQGVQEAYADSGEQFPEAAHFIINGTKENAFKAAIEFTNVSTLPDAVLCTSSEIAKGAMEAFSALQLKIPEDMLLVTLGEESWNRSEHLAGVIYTTRNASTLGASAGRMLLEHVNAPEEHPLHEEQLTDRFQNQKFSPPPRRKTPAIARSTQTDLRILSFFAMYDGSQVAIQNILRIYEAETGMRVHFDRRGYRGIHNQALLNYLQHEAKYDGLLMDLPWKDAMIKINAVSKLDDLVERPDFPRDRILNCDSRNFYYKGSCYGLPIINGAQTLFYRRDLFEDADIKAAYYKKHNSLLRPPRTWAEYNRVAAFFTRSINPASPTEWGTAEIDDDVGALMGQNYGRFLTAGGSLYDAQGRFRLDTPQNRAAFEAAIAPHQYKYRRYSSCPNAIEDFCMGHTAMLLTFNDNAANFMRESINRNSIGQLGFALPPEGQNICAGWALGIHPQSPQREELYRLYKWMMRTDISYYYTILSGNTTCKLPYQNGEILDLYPWMALYPNGECAYFSRPQSSTVRSDVQVSNDLLEALFCDIIRRLVENKAPIGEILQDAQRMLMDQADIAPSID